LATWTASSESLRSIHSCLVRHARVRSAPPRSVSGQRLDPPSAPFAGSKSREKKVQIFFRALCARKSLTTCPNHRENLMSHPISVSPKFYYLLAAEGAERDILGCLRRPVAAHQVIADPQTYTPLERTHRDLSSGI
jgi:hypothetical protein